MVHAMASLVDDLVDRAIEGGRTITERLEGVQNLEGRPLALWTRGSGRKVPLRLNGWPRLGHKSFCPFCPDCL